jgi:hypothetical protein
MLKAEYGGWPTGYSDQAANGERNLASNSVCNGTIHESAKHRPDLDHGIPQCQPCGRNDVGFARGCAIRMPSHISIRLECISSCHLGGTDSLPPPVKLAELCGKSRMAYWNAGIATARLTMIRSKP